MPPTTPLVDASVATALISPDPLSYITTKKKDEEEKEKADKTNQLKAALSKIAANSEEKFKAGGGGSKSDTTKQQQPRPQQESHSDFVTADERFYAVDGDILEKLRSDKPWTKPESQAAAVAENLQQQQQQQQGGGNQQQHGNQSGTSTKPPRPVAKFFESLSLSPSAVTKMMMHCQSGVEKGISKGGNPIEVMGLMLGRPDPHQPTNLIVTDAFALPIEGFETRVIADDQSVINHMISLGERLEMTRKEKFMGWYHSHPFDLVLGEEARTHCFLSQTDLSTQLQWQRAEDPHGNPFAAIVVDPLLSMHTGTPQLKAFRAYPPEYQSAIANECPDGSIVASEKLRLEKWGSCWNRYYELNVEYYMSAASRSVLGDLTQNYLWMKSFQRDSNEDGIGGTDTTKGISVAEATKVSTLREIATEAKFEMATGGEGRPTSRAAKIEPLVRKLRELGTVVLTQQTARRVQTNVFEAPHTTMAKAKATANAKAKANENATADTMGANEGGESGENNTNDNDNDNDDVIPIDTIATH